MEVTTKIYSYTTVCLAATWDSLQCAYRFWA